MTKRQKLKELMKTTLLAGGLTVIATEMTPQSWQAFADSHGEKNHQKGCGANGCGGKESQEKMKKKMAELPECKGEKSTSDECKAALKKAHDKGCGANGCG